MNPEYPGLFVSVEGCDGCGKTTVIALLKKALEEKGVTPLVTREPGGGRIAESIRAIILDKENTNEDKRTEALLYAASRRQHLVDVVIPALQKGTLVISDRYLDSSLAYQGYARGIGIEEVYSINAFAIDGYMPEITFYLDLPPKEGLARIAAHRSDKVDRLDVEKLSSHEKVYEGYKIVNEKYKDRIVRIDAHKTPEEEVQEILPILLLKYQEKKQ